MKLVLSRRYTYSSYRHWQVRQYPVLYAIDYSLIIIIPILSFALSVNLRCLPTIAATALALTAHLPKLRPQRQVDGAWHLQSAELKFAKRHQKTFLDNGCSSLSTARLVQHSEFIHAPSQARQAHLSHTALYVIISTIRYVQPRSQTTRIVDRHCQRTTTQAPVWLQFGSPASFHPRTNR